jgi:hypothetical protein
LASLPIDERCRIEFGCTRMVFLIGRLAVKLPTLRTWSDIERRALQPGGLRAQGRRFRLDREARDCIRQAGGYPHPRTAYD